ncbi:MAG: hypothetical protein NVS2B12_22340 [Ktedonobacteraceae bacterium]
MALCKRRVLYSSAAGVLSTNLLYLQEAFQAAWPALAQNAPAGEWEVKPPEVYMFNATG